MSHIALAEDSFEIPQLQLRRWFPCKSAGSTGAVVEKTVEIPQLRPVGARPRCAGQQVPHSCEETVEIPLLLLVHAGVVDVPVVVHMPVVVQRLVP